jgi:hypothetical protein
MPALAALLSFFMLSSCSKSGIGNEKDIASFDQYFIPAGEHYSRESTVKKTAYSELKFLVIFDSSAIYFTSDPANQYDINKLYGFADNSANHHEFSARIGWRWSDNALRLFGYVYNNGEVSYEELSTVSIGMVHDCSISIADSGYIFSVDGNKKTMPRTSTGPIANGYKLFPYFGGDETAPHDIHVWIKEK